MTAIVEGVLKRGIIELLEVPSGLAEGRVQVIVIAKDQPKPPACLLKFGKYQVGRMSTLEDFELARWHGVEGFDPNFG
jgi:hypothetical protein